MEFLGYEWWMWAAWAAIGVPAWICGVKFSRWMGKWLYPFSDRVSERFANWLASRLSSGKQTDGEGR